jgi:chemotaxis protein methyltransferase CheR
VEALKSLVIENLFSLGVIMDSIVLNLNEKHYKTISEMTYAITGIKLCDGKQELVKSRLGKRIRALKLKNFDEYLLYLEKDHSQQELRMMIDSLTTNKTNFFREMPHFDYLKNRVLPALAGKKIRIWSAGCSTGEEPYSIAIMLREELHAVDTQDVVLLATDISSRVLSKAKEGVYPEEALKEVPQTIISKYFAPAPSSGQRLFRAQENLKKLIRFAHLNLMGEWPMKGPFNVIFCRNVMIYFDKETQCTLVDRYFELLTPGGYLFIGHSESLTGFQHRFKYIQPATYMR